MDAFWRGNLESLRQLLEQLGLTVNTFFTAEDSLDEIRMAAGAELNIVVSDRYGVEAAQVFQEVHGTPYLALPLPIGPTATKTFIEQVSAALALENTRSEQVIAREEKRYYHYLEPLVECYNDLDLQRYAVVVGDINYAPALTKFLADDLGWLPELVAITDPLNEDEQASITTKRFQFESGLEPKVIFETDASEILRYAKLNWPENHGQKYYNAFGPAFVLGSSLDRELAQGIGAGHLSVSFPVANRAIIDRGYSGYQGGLRLIEDLISNIVAGR
jgi:nitrogenase molybdenum-iron protein beta chain